MTVYDYGFIVPIDTQIDNLSDDFRNFVAQFEPRWPMFPVMGTKPVDGTAVLGVRLCVKLSLDEISALITQFALGWRCVFIRSAYDPYDNVLIPEKAAILPFMLPVITGYDDNMQTVTRDITVDDEVVIPWYTGTEITL